MVTQNGAGPRCIAIVGPYGTGKTALLESLLLTTGAIAQKGTASKGNRVGDTGAEARAHEMGVEMNVAGSEYLGDIFTFLDCPGSIEFFQESIDAGLVADGAIVVCDSEPGRIQALSPYLKLLDSQQIPHLIYINKVDKEGLSVSEMFEELKDASDVPLILRQIPIRDGDRIAGFVDLGLQRAYRFGREEEANAIAVPDDLAERVESDRFALLETLADFDDHLMEELLEDVEPDFEEVVSDLAEDVAQNRIVPVLFGSGEHDWGVWRLLKALRHEIPGFDVTRARLLVDEIPGNAVVQAFKIFHFGHTGKQTLVRVMKGKISDGMSLNGERVSGVSALMGHNLSKLPEGTTGDVVALGKLEHAQIGDTLVDGDAPGSELQRPDILQPVYGLAITMDDKSAEVKLSAALREILEEDPSLEVEHNQDTGEMILWGQGEMRLRIVSERLKSHYGITVQTSVPQVPYKEAIRKPATQRGRYKKQSGGHGQYGDVVLEIKPLPRGEGFVFSESITGGVVPKQYIPSVEAGVKDYLQRGPLGFPVVDVAVELTDGSHHSVDSSDMAFRSAGRLAMSEALPLCDPILLEPIVSVEISVPNDATANVNALISSRRGQILGFEPRPGWNGWDVVKAFLPQAEMQDLIIELRSLTQGAGSFTWQFDHLQELSGRLADDVVAARAHAFDSGSSPQQATG